MLNLDAFAQTYSNELIKRWKTRKTGATVEMYDFRKQNADEKGKSWGLRCANHGTLKFFSTKEEAWVASRDTTGFCPDCLAESMPDGSLPNKPAPAPAPKPEPSVPATPTEDMPKTSANIASVGRRLMDEHGFADIPLKMNTRLTRAMGRAMYKQGFLGEYKPLRMELSPRLLKHVPWEEITDTILHEIAHLMTPGDHHGPAWKAACRKVGAKPERVYKGGAIPKTAHKYTATCKGCGLQVGFNRWTKKWNQADRLRHGSCDHGFTVKRNR